MVQNLPLFSCFFAFFAIAGWAQLPPLVLPEKITAEMPPLPAPISVLSLPPAVLSEERRILGETEPDQSHRCKGESVTLTSPDGSITWRSPWTENERKYLKNVDTCYWFIKLPENYRIRLSFDYFNIIESNDCSGDHLVVFDTAGNNQPGSSANTPVATLCGKLTPKDIESRGSEVMVAFRSFSHLSGENNNGQQHGFKLSYHGITEDQRNEVEEPPGGTVHSEELPVDDEEFEYDDDEDVPILETTHFPPRFIITTTPEQFIYRRNFSHFSDSIRPTPSAPFRPQIRPVIGSGKNELKPLLNTVAATNGLKVTPSYQRQQPKLKPLSADNSDRSNLLSEISWSKESSNQEVFTSEPRLYPVNRQMAPTKTPKKTTAPIVRLHQVSSSPSPKLSIGGGAFLSDANQSAGKCNGRIRLLTAETGQLSSPNFGYGNYHPNDLCFWQIIAPEDKRIRLGFSFLMLQPESGCYADYLNIYDGASETGSLIAAFCGAKSPPPDREILTTSNTAFIKFATDGAGEFPGFQIGYEFFDASVSASIDAYGRKHERLNPEPSSLQRSQQRGHPPLTGEMYCGGRRQLLFAPNGSIESPIFDPSLPSDRLTSRAPDECFWLISAPADGQIRVTFKELNLRYGHKCPDDSVSLYEGRADPNEGSKPGGVDLGRLLATFCGPNLPAPITSETNELLVGYTTRGGKIPANHGFRLEYEQIQSPEPVCMGRAITLTSSPGYISTPNYGRGNYAANDQCSWLLVAGPNQRIKLVFEKFSLEESANCVKDSLIVFDVGQRPDGDYEDDEPPSQRAPLRDLCGHEVPVPVVSETNSVEIKFISDSSDEDRGANVFYEFIDTKIGGRPEYVRNERQHRGSPILSGQQQQSQSQYQQEQEWRNVRRTKSYFKTTPAWRTTTTTESQALYEDDYEDDEEEDQPLVPVPKLVQGPDGFVAILARDPVDKTSDQEISSVVGRCGNKSSLLTAESGVIESPGFKRGFYPDADECQWLIIADAKRRIRLFFETFDIELEPLCSHDSLTVYDGPTSETSEPLGVYCGQGQPDPVESNGPYMLVRFHTDAAGSGKGFKLYYNFTGMPPDLPNNELPLVTASLVTLASTRAPRITTPPKDPLNSANIDNATMNFLQALIRGVVKGSHDKTDHESLAPRRPPRRKISTTTPEPEDETEPDVDPELELVPKTGLELETDNGARTTAPYTWPTSESLTTTLGRPLFSSITDRCRGRVGVIVLNAPLTKRGSLASPNFGTATYANDDVCRWEIRSSAPRTRIRLRFVKFHLESGSPLCQNDFVEIFDGPGANFPLIGRFCGEQLPPNIVSTGNQIAVRFVSDGMLAYAGFYVEYGAEPIEDGTMSSPKFFLETVPPFTSPTTPSTTTTTTTEPPTTTTTTEATTITTQPAPMLTIAEQERCDGRLHQLVATGMPQFFTSPNFGPGRSYPSKDICYWIVTSPSRLSNRVRLTFRYFDLEPPSPRCNPGDSLSIFDGAAETSPLLAVYCGSALPADVVSQTSTSLFIKFQSDGAHNFPGFVAAFDEITSVHKNRRFNETRQNTQRNENNDGDYYDDEEISPPQGNTRPKVIPLSGNDDQDLPPPLIPQPNRRKKNRKRPSNLAPRWACHSGDGSPLTLRAGRAARFLSSHEDFSLDESGASSFYPPNLDCSWLITANQTGSEERIRLTFDEFRVERGLSDISCLSDYVVIFDGPTEESETVRKLCGIDGKDFSFISTTPNLLIKFHTDRTVEDAGFRLRYESISVHSANKYLDNSRPCAGRLHRLPPASSQQVQTFSSPNYGAGRKYFPNDSCKWLIIGDQLVTKLRLRFITFFVENRTPNCANDHIIVYDGADETSPVIGKFCGLTAPPELTSSGRKMLIRFFSDNSIEYSGFSAEYTTFQENLLAEEPQQPQQLVDGEVLFEEEHTTSSSTASTTTTQTEPPTTSTTTITSTTTSSTTTTSTSAPNLVKAVYMEQSQTGPTGLFQGYQPFPPPIHYRPVAVGRSLSYQRSRNDFAGSTGPSSISMSMPRTHNQAPDRTLPRCNGQVFTINLMAPGSGQMETNETGVVIASPNYEGNHYIFNDECMWSVSVSAPDSKIRLHFDDFDVQYSEGCYKDRLLIYDGGISGPQVFGPFCGQFQLPDMMTRTNSALIKFNTDEAIEMRGFRLTLTATEFQSSPTTTSTTTSTTTTSLPPTTKPHVFPPWHHFNGRDKSGATGPSSGPGMLVDGYWFSKDGVNIANKFNTDRQHDHGNGQVPSPPPPHGNMWQEPSILENVPSTQKVSTSILPPDFDLESFNRPFVNYRSSNRLGSGAELPISGITKGNIALVTPMTQEETTTQTSTTITSTSGIIELERLHEPCRDRVFEFDESTPVDKRIIASPADEANGRYFAADICYYRITAPIGRRVRLDFFEPFDLEASITCLYDKMRIYDGTNEQSPLGGVFCGMTAPEPYLSTENVVFIKFQSDSTQNRAGFVVKFSYIS